MIVLGYFRIKNTKCIFQIGIFPGLSSSFVKMKWSFWAHMSALFPAQVLSTCSLQDSQGATHMLQAKWNKEETCMLPSRLLKCTHKHLKHLLSRQTKCGQPAWHFGVKIYSMYEQHRSCYGNPSPCCHAALLLNTVIWLDNADSTVTWPKHCQNNHLGKQGHLAEGCWRLRRLCLLTALAIMRHLVYQTPTEGGREQESGGWEKTRGRVPHSVNFFFYFHVQIFTQLYRGEGAIWQKLPLPWQKKREGPAL